MFSDRDIIYLGLTFRAKFCYNSRNIVVCFLPMLYLVLSVATVNFSMSLFSFFWVEMSIFAVNCLKACNRFEEFLMGSSERIDAENSAYALTFS